MLEHKLEYHYLHKFSFENKNSSPFFLLTSHSAISNVQSPLKNGGLRAS